MNSHSKAGRDDRTDKGFTLVEILIAIVLVGILSAVAVVGISNLVSKGSSSACSSSLDASKAASAVYFASHSTYPTTFAQLTTDQAAVVGPPAIAAYPAPLSLPSGVTVAGLVASSGTAWTLTMTAGTATTAPTFVCA